MRWGAYRWFVPAGIVVGGVWDALGAASATSGPQSSSLVHEELNAAIWTKVIGQDSGMSMTAHPGWLTLPTETASVRAFATQIHDLVLQAVAARANGTARVEATFFGKKFTPAGTLPNYQGGGIFARESPAQWVRVWREPSNCQVDIQSMVTSGGFVTGTPTASAQAVVCNQADDPLGLRLQKQADVYTAFSSIKGFGWEEVAPPTTATGFSPAYVGWNTEEGTGTAPPTDMGFRYCTVEDVKISSSGTAGASTSASTAEPSGASPPMRAISSSRKSTTRHLWPRSSVLAFQRPAMVQILNWPDVSPFARRGSLSLGTAAMVRLFPRPGPGFFAHTLAF